MVVAHVIIQKNTVNHYLCVMFILVISEQIESFVQKECTIRNIDLFRNIECYFSKLSET